MNGSATLSDYDIQALAKDACRENCYQFEDCGFCTCNGWRDFVDGVVDDLARQRSAEGGEDG